MVSELLKVTLLDLTALAMLFPQQPKAKKTRKFAEMKRMISAKDARM